MAEKTGLPIEKVKQVEEFEYETLTVNELLSIDDSIGLDVSIRFKEMPLGAI